MWTTVVLLGFRFNFFEDTVRLSETRSRSWYRGRSCIKLHNTWHVSVLCFEQYTKYTKALHSKLLHAILQQYKTNKPGHVIFTNKRNQIIMLFVVMFNQHNTAKRTSYPERIDREKKKDLFIQSRWWFPYIAVFPHMEVAVFLLRISCCVVLHISYRFK